MELLTKLAPWLGTALGGPLGGIAATYVAKALGVSDTTVEAVKAVLAGPALTGEQLAAVRVAESEFILKMKELGFKEVSEMARIENEDRASARAREMHVQDKTPRNLAYAITVGFFGMLIGLMCADIPTGSKDILNIMLGSLGTAWISSISYYFGKNSDSARTKEMLYTSVAK